MTTRTSKLATGSRIVLGLIFFVFGLNGFLHFIPQPAPAGNMATFMSGMMATGYFFPMLKGVEVIAGLALLANRFVPLALTVLAPIVVNIVAVHLFMAPEGLPIAAALVAAELVLAWSYRAAFAPMLKARASTSVTVEARSEARELRVAA